MDARDYKPDAALLRECINCHRPWPEHIRETVHRKDGSIDESMTCHPEVVRLRAALGEITRLGRGVLTHAWDIAARALGEGKQGRRTP